MLKNRLELQGRNHLRWRIALVLLLAPFAAYAFMNSGWMTARLGAAAEESWDIFCLLIALFGLGMRLHIAGHNQAAEAGKLLPDGQFRSSGLYSIMRHPVCVANFLIILSGSLLFKNAFFTVLVAIVACIYYERLILAKERIMVERHGEEFAVWAAKTPLVIPRFSLWIGPSSRFSLAAAVRREAVTFAFIGLMFFLLETLEGTMIDGLPFWEWTMDEPQWLILFVISAAILWTQLSRVWAILVLFLSSLIAGALYFEKILPLNSVGENRSLNALKAGGHVLLLRHAFTVGTDQEEVQVNDCSTQRNLSERGREYARALGTMLRNSEVKIARTITSQYCRTRETAQLIGVEISGTMSNLDEQPTHVTLFERLFGNSEKDEKTFRPVRRIIENWKEQGTLLLVSHAPVITGLSYNSLGMGEGLVLKPAPNSALGFKVVGKLPALGKVP